MARLKRTGEGFTLVELVVAVALSAVVLLAASNLLINFGNFSSNVVKHEAALAGTALGAFEEIVGNIQKSNQATILAGANPPNSSIMIRIDDPDVPTPSVFGDDSMLDYYLASGGGGMYQLRERTSERMLADNVYSLSFEMLNANKVKVILEARTSGGTKEHLETIAVMRSRSAN